MSQRTSNNAPHASGMETDSPQPPTRRRRKRLRIALIVLGSLLALIAIAAGIAYALAANSFNEVQRVSITPKPSMDRPDASPVTDARSPLNILLLGSDAREAPAEGNAGENLQGFRSDAIMVAQISADREHITVMSIMRDNWVQIHGHGEAKINAAMSYGGLPLAVNTVENFIGARIDHVALIDFESFQGLTDTIGGVTVHNSAAFTAQNGGGGFTFGEGEITLNGEEALSFVRERYAFSDGDYQRARNQQAYIRGLTQKLLSRDTLSSPDRVVDAFEAVKPYLVLDDGLDLGTAIGLGLELRGLRSTDLTFFTSPTLGTSESADGQSIVLPDFDELTRVQDAFHAGTLHEYAQTRDPGAESPS